MPPKSKTAKKQDIAKNPTKPTKSNAGTATLKQPPPIDWPPITPLIPAAELSLTTLLENQILTIPRLWTSTLCKTYVSFLSSLPLVTTPGKPKRGEATRVNDRFQVDDAAFAKRVWSETALKEIAGNPIVDERALGEVEKRALWGGEVLGLSSNIRVYRYSKGQFFDQHCESRSTTHSLIWKAEASYTLSMADSRADDDSNNVLFPSATSSSPVPAKTTWTLLLYLSSPVTGCKGGETVFYPDPPSKREAAPSPVVAELEVGMALLHRHGKDCLLHEGREVTEGEKWIIRSDLCVKR